MYQKLSLFKLPSKFRGRSALYVQLWWLVQSVFFRLSPQFAYGWRAFLLRLFGAKVGVNSVIRPSVEFTYPWNVELGDNVWVGDNAVFYSLGKIVIGDDAVVSQRSYLCAGDHDYTKIDFPIQSKMIVVGKEAWLAADVFVAPGISIGDGAVIGARSSVFRDMPMGMVCMGNPCKPIKARIITRTE